MKKFLSMILVILLCVTYLASCGKTLNSPDVLDGVDSESDLETPKNEEPKDETPKDETPKDETPKDETPKDETPKDETPKDETPKDETPKDETPKDETPKDETPKDEPTEEPKDEPTEEPKDEPTEEPKDEPTEEPKDEPTEEPKDEPTEEPKDEPKEEEPQIDPSRIVTVTPTNFAARFSQANEDLLAKILASPIKNTSVENILPSLPVIPSKKYPAGDGGYTYIYENVGKTVYDHCCATISAAGYARYTTNEITGLALPDWYVYNPSMTLISDTAKIDIDLHTGMNRMYINVTPRSASVLPQREAKSYVKPEGNYPTMWVQYGLEDISKVEASMGYIIRIADGSFIIIDSGEYIDGVETRMYNILKKLAPDPNNIVISAWMITHAHTDHVGGFVKFVNKYSSDKTIKLKQFLFNFPDDSKVTDYWEKHDQNWAKQLAKGWGAEMLKVHTGNVLYYADIKIKILYTQENYLSANANGIMGDYNGASIVTQFVMGDGTKVLVGADHPVDGSYDGVNWCENSLIKYYGTALESKVVTTFHHGFGGGANDSIYGVIKPKVVLWDVDEYRITKNADGSSYSTSLTSVSHNKYFTTNGASNGVTYYTAGGSSVTVLQFANGNPSVKRYSNYNEFMAS